MMLTFGIGERTESVEIADENVLDVLHPNHVDVDLYGEAEVRRALVHPIGSPPLRQIVKTGERIAIITSDVTRPMPTWRVMPALLDELYAAGCDAKDITLVFALGSHRHHTRQEIEHLAGARAVNEINCIDCDSTDCVHLGTTAKGTPVDITRVVAEADRRICLGNIEYHYFAGYSGGAKAIMPGVSTRDAIQSNHSMMVLPEAFAGNLENNPLRMDIEEAAAICGVDFIVNVVLDEHKEIIRAVAGDVTKAHREGCAFLNELYRKEICKRADIVIVSQGGAPKDLNLYQTQKALDNSKHAVREGGIIILVGSCKEGMGERTFEQWMTEANKPQDIIDRIKVDFRLGGHKAAAIAMVLGKADVYFVSDREDSFAKNAFMKPFKSVAAAYAAACDKLGKNASVIAMPYGGSTLPKALNN